MPLIRHLVRQRTGNRWASRSLLALICAGVCALPLAAQRVSVPDSTIDCAVQITREQFAAAFNNALGTWHVSILDFDDRGDTTYQGTQTRQFDWAIGNRYVEERAFTTGPTGQTTHLGLMLYSFDDDAGTVLLVSFWPRSPRRWAEFRGCLVPGQIVSLEGTLRSFRPGEPERIRRAEIRFESATQIRWRNYARHDSGEEYLAEELVYAKLE